MARKAIAALKQSWNNQIKENDNQEITGAILNSQGVDLIDSLKLNIASASYVGTDLDSNFEVEITHQLNTQYIMSAVWDENGVELGRDVVERGPKDGTSTDTYVLSYHEAFVDPDVKHKIVLLGFDFLTIN